MGVLRRKKKGQSNEKKHRVPSWWFFFFFFRRNQHGKVINSSTLTSSHDFSWHSGNFSNLKTSKYEQIFFHVKSSRKEGKKTKLAGPEKTRKPLMSERCCRSVSTFLNQWPRAANEPNSLFFFFFFYPHSFGHIVRWLKHGNYLVLRYSTRIRFQRQVVQTSNHFWL